MPAKRTPTASPARAATTEAPQRVYLDHNATTPLDPRVLEAMLPFLTEAYGNAASTTHTFGRAASAAVERARAQVAALINADPKEIVWTSGATEANNLAIKGAAQSLRAGGRHIVTQATEHNAVLDPCRHLEQEGFELTVLAVDGSGLVDPASVARAIRPDTVLVSVMYANNEIGTVQPVREIGAICRERGVLFHTDATQATGKIPVDVRLDLIDLLSLSAHKFYGPKGCGALYVRQRTPRTRLTPQLHGGGHERGFRSGTLNVPGIVGTGAACDIARSAMQGEAVRLRGLRDRLESQLCAAAGARPNGSRDRRLPHVASLTFAGVEAEAALVALDDVALSTGSACTSASVQPSHVLLAIGVDGADAHRTLRFSLGRGTTEADVAYAVGRVLATVGRLRELGSFN